MKYFQTLSVSEGTKWLVVHSGSVIYSLTSACDYMYKWGAVSFCVSLMKLSPLGSVSVAELEEHGLYSRVSQFKF